MKIIVDKIDEYPEHAISRADVRLILASVPPEWSGQVKVVRLSSSRSPMGAVILVQSDNQLTIASRGQTKAAALHGVLAELAAHGLGFKRWPFEHLQARYRAQVESLVSPLMTELLPQLSRRIAPLI